MWKPCHEHGMNFREEINQHLSTKTFVSKIAYDSLCKTGLGNVFCQANVTLSLSFFVEEKYRMYYNA